MYLIMISIHMNGLYMDIISIHVFPRRREIASQLAAIRIQAGARGFLTRSQAEPPKMAGNQCELWISVIYMYIYVYMYMYYNM